MTEQDWLESRSPKAMLNSLPDKGFDRKYLLFACACARRVWHLLEDDRPRRVIQITEEFADGKIDQKTLRSAWCAARSYAERQEKQGLWISAFAAHAAHHAAPGWKADFPEYQAQACAVAASFTAAETVAGAARGGAMDAEGNERVLRAKADEQEAQAKLVRDVFRSPFRSPSCVEPACRTEAVKRLAQDIYEVRSFDRLGELADALEQAGCQNDEVLSHLRSNGPHERGCWALDVVLEKTEHQ
jgi:hypothetical protein